jgi:hypothetical protein
MFSMITIIAGGKNIYLNDIIPPLFYKYHSSRRPGETEGKTEPAPRHVTHHVHSSNTKPKSVTHDAHFEVMRESENHDRASP